MGIGFGMGLTTLLTFARAVVEEKHMGKFRPNRRISHSHSFTKSIPAVMMGAITQIRVLGGTISLAIW